MTYPPLWKFKSKGKAVLEGTYVGQYPNIGRYKNALFAIKSVDGKTYTIWGTREIKQALALRPIGKKVRIQFIGKVKASKSGFPVDHYQINIGKGKLAASLENNRRHGKTARSVAASRTPTRQSLARPLTTAGRGLASDSAANPKRKYKKKLKITGMVWDDIPRPPRGYLDEAMEPPPPYIPPQIVDKPETVTAAWLEKQKKLKK